MDIDNITLDLRRRFTAPLPEFYKRRIIFWYDEDREFEDQLSELVIEGVEVAALTGSNTFAVKKLLCEDDLTSNYLVYDPRSFTKDDDNWLINVQLYSEEFRADLVSIWMDEMGLVSSPILRSLVKHYRKFFRAKDRRDAVKRFAGGITTAAQMHMAVMAALAGCSALEPGRIIKAVLCDSLDGESNSIYQGFAAYGADEAFRAMAAQVAGYGNDGEMDLGRLAVHLLLTAATRTMHSELLAGLEPMISEPHQAYCYDLVSDWLRSEDRNKLWEIGQYVEAEARLQQRFEKLSVGDLLNTECFPCINTCILIALMKEVADNIIRPEQIRSVVERRRTLAWYDEVSDYYEGLLRLAEMQSFNLEHAAGFHTVEPDRIWKEYTTDYYRMDACYRRFHLCFRRSLKNSDPLLDDLFKQVAEKAEGLYVHRFLGPLAENWTNAAADDLQQYGYIMDVPRQTDFYRAKVKNSDSRSFVIISDAFRYEAAVSLAEQLQREMQCKVTLNSCQAMFPTATKYGMAALLPHQRLEVVPRGGDVLGVLADGQPTDAGSREKVLKAAKPHSAALKYDSLIEMKRVDRQALVKGKDVVYIYHDRVDAASHTADCAVFSACDEAIAEIKNLIRIIVNEFSGTNIIVTADHGFLYTYNPLGEDGKVDRTTPSDMDVEVERRYLITRKGADPAYLLPVRFPAGGEHYDAFAPRENIRIKKKGGGLNFVHGGISLQEMVVPVLEFQYLRSNSKAYLRSRELIDTKPVTVSLVSAGRKISNMIFSLNFFQKEAVGGNREPATYLLYFEDAAGQKVSDTCKIIADKAGEGAPERSFHCSFHLKSQKFSNREAYYLVIADESGLQAPVREEFRIDIAFAFDEFLF